MERRTHAGSGNERGGLPALVALFVLLVASGCGRADRAVPSESAVSEAYQTTSTQDDGWTRWISHTERLAAAKNDHLPSWVDLHMEALRSGSQIAVVVFSMLQPRLAETPKELKPTAVLPGGAALGLQDGVGCFIERAGSSDRVLGIQFYLKRDRRDAERLFLYGAKGPRRKALAILRDVGGGDPDLTRREALIRAAVVLTPLGESDATSLLREYVERAKRLENLGVSDSEAGEFVSMIVPMLWNASISAELEVASNQSPFPSEADRHL